MLKPCCDRNKIKLNNFISINVKYLKQNKGYIFEPCEMYVQHVGLYKFKIENSMKIIIYFNEFSINLLIT